MERATLNQLQVATPCTVSWDAMKGDDQVRLCGDCKCNVYNISEMSLDEISHLLEKKEGRTCVRFFRRFDGTVITDDCPTGLRAARRRLMKVAMAIAAAVTGSVIWNGSSLGRALRESPLGKVEMGRQLADWLDPQISRPIHMGLPARLDYTAPRPSPQCEIKGEMVAPQVKMGKVVHTR